MLKFDFNGFKIDQNKNIAEKISQLKSRGQGFYEIIDDHELLVRIEIFSKKILARGIKKIVVLGIGGSALGAICLKQAFGDLFEARMKSGVTLEVLDNIDPAMISECHQTINFAETLFLVITKSGSTPETLAQFLYFRAALVDKGLDWKKHFVFITDPKKGLLRELADQNPEIETFPVPENVGGRFSIFTAVGLVPAALMGIDIKALVKGAKLMRDKFFSNDFSENWSWQLALAQFELYQNGVNQTVMFPYAQKLSRLADWYRQLLGESIGKELNRMGQKVNIGITPVTALGVTDQHSQNQLYNEGPADKLYIFLEVLKPEVDLNIPFDENFSDQLGYLRNVSFNKLLLTEMAGTIDSLLEKKRPIIRISMENLDEITMGELIMLFEGSIAFLGELFEIDAYNQPGVELSKILTRKMLDN